jgi:hypothetical protein
LGYTRLCGGAPSEIVVQYDFRTQYPNGFIWKDTIDANLVKPNKDTRGLLAFLEEDFLKEALEDGIAFS